VQDQREDAARPILFGQPALAGFLERLEQHHRDAVQFLPDRHRQVVHVGAQHHDRTSR